MEILDEITVAGFWNEWSPVMNECRLGRSKKLEYQIDENYFPSIDFLLVRMILFLFQLIED